MDGIHDMGGMAGFGPVPVDEVASGHEGWEARLQAVALLSSRGLRGAIEAIPPDQYLTTSYGGRWVLAGERAACDRGVIGRSDLDHWRSEVRAGGELPRTSDPARVERLGSRLFDTPLLRDAGDARFAVGDRVRVLRMRPEPHHRCPRYVRGVVGVIEKVPGSDFQPHRVGDDESIEPVYTVMFRSTDVWGDQTTVGEEPFDVMVDLWESYLEAA